MEKHKDVIKRLKKGTSIRDVAEITKKSTATIQKVLKVMKEQEKEKENKEIIKKTNRKPITNNLD